MRFKALDLKPFPAAARLLAAAAACLPLLLLPAPALPQGLGESDLVIVEKFTIELTPTGDAHITDVFDYKTDHFEEYSDIFEDYPGLLSRRYRGDTDIGEIENFNVKVNDRKGTVTVTFDSPGLAYHMGDSWHVYGFAYKPSKTRDTELVFEGEGTLKNEFTLFEEAALALTTTVKLPAGASEAAYLAADGAVKYVLPYEEGGGGSFFQRNKGALTPVCIVLMALSLLLLAYLILSGSRTRAAGGPAAAAAPPHPPSPPAPRQAPAAPRPSAGRPGGFCKHCGAAVGDPSKGFCAACGKPLA